MKVKELKKDSREEVDFKTLLGCIMDMIKLSGQIELLEMIFPVIRENLPDSYQNKINIFIK